MSDLEHRLTVGTRRAQSLGAADEVALGEIVSELVADQSTAADSMEWRLLLAAGTKAVLSRAGQRRPATNVLPFELSADEAEYGEPVRQLLEQLLDPPRDDMLVSLLDQLSASPKRLPLKLTPFLLAWASARPAAQPSWRRFFQVRADNGSAQSKLAMDAIRAANSAANGHRASHASIA